MTKKKQATSKKTRFANRQLVIISTLIAVIIVVLGTSLAFVFLRGSDPKFSLNAAIIDQLGESFPNPQFVSETTTILEAAGFNVTYHKNEELNVMFFKQLAKGNYGILILRVHSALRNDNSTVDFFTSEEFSESNYWEERQNELLTKGSYLWEPTKFYFAITSKFVETLEGRFPRSIVIAMGCRSLKQGCEQMAEAFRAKGAEAYVGWTETVEINHTDRESISLLKMLVEENKTLEQSVNLVLPDYHFYPFISKMRYNPPTAANLTLSGLIAEAKSSSPSNNQATMTSLREMKSNPVINSVVPRKQKEL